LSNGQPTLYTKQTRPEQKPEVVKTSVAHHLTASYLRPHLPAIDRCHHSKENHRPTTQIQSWGREAVRQRAATVPCNIVKTPEPGPDVGACAELSLSIDGSQLAVNIGNAESLPRPPAGHPASL